MLRRLWLFSVASLLVAQSARAGNDESIPIGPLASITGPAVTAVVGADAGSWYNPAGLAKAERPTADTSLQLYGLRYLSVDDFIVYPDGNGAGADVVDWQLIPSSLSYVRRLGELRIGVGAYIPRTSDYEVRISGSQPDTVTLATRRRSHFYNYGLTVAYPVSERLRIGATLFGTYTSSYTSRQLAGGSATTESLNYSDLIGLSRYGLRVNVGAQWDIDERWTVGAAFYSPAWSILGSTRRNVAATLTRTDGTVDFLQVAPDDRSDRGTVEPYTARLGIAYQWADGHIAIDGTLSGRLDATEAFPIVALREPHPFNRDLVANVMIGIRQQVAESFTWGGGFFTDLSPYDSDSIDYFGVITGIAIERELRLDDGRPLTLFTTLGARYALGVGDVVQVVLPNAVSLNLPEFGASDVLVHELSANVGTGVHF